MPPRKHIAAKAPPGKPSRLVDKTLASKARQHSRSHSACVRLNPREKGTLMRYCIENDLSESNVIRKGLLNLLRQAYPDFETTKFIDPNEALD